jgi:hypothetical protein
MIWPTVQSASPAGFEAASEEAGVLGDAPPMPVPGTTERRPYECHGTMSTGRQRRQETQHR